MDSSYRDPSLFIMNLIIEIGLPVLAELAISRRKFS